MIYPPFLKLSESLNLTQQSHYWIHTFCSQNCFLSVCNITLQLYKPRTYYRPLPTITGTRTVSHFTCQYTVTDYQEHTINVVKPKTICITADVCMHCKKWSVWTLCSIYLVEPPSSAISGTSRSWGSPGDWGCKSYAWTWVPAWAPGSHTADGEEGNQMLHYKHSKSYCC